jgi:hypothetical protein
LSRRRRDVGLSSDHGKARGQYGNNALELHCVGLYWCFCFLEIVTKDAAGASAYANVSTG